MSSLHRQSIGRQILVAVGITASAVIILVLVLAQSGESSTTAPAASPTVMAPDLADSLPATLQVGDCDDLDLEETVSLTPLERRSGPHAEAVTYAAETYIDVPLADLVITPHTITVGGNAPSSGITLACGTVPDERPTDTIVVGLQTSGGGDLAGIAVLTETSEEGTTVAIYLALSGDLTPVGADDLIDQPLERSEEAPGNGDIGEQDSPDV